MTAGESRASRPEVLAGRTFKIRSPFGTVNVTLNENGENSPFELFLNTAKNGSDLSADAEAIGRLCSLLLRISSPVPELRRIELIIEILSGIRGGSDSGSGENQVRSVPDAVAFALTQYLESKRTDNHKARRQEGLESQTHNHRH